MFIKTNSTQWMNNKIRKKRKMKKKIPQSRVQKPCMAHKAFLVDIHDDGFPIRDYVDVSARLGVLAM